MVSEKGSLKDTPAIQLLLSIFEQGLTGILYIKREYILKVLYCSRGKLIWAISNSDVDKLENILSAKNLVPKETINNVKKQAKVSDSIGKLLVEKGFITLEELIESSKEQLRRIINSILKWKVGGFQFVKEAPPEHLLSLDLDVIQFVVNYIVEEVDIKEIWNEIRTLQSEFIKNPDEQKVTKYHLSDEQKELLNSFDGKTKLETILSSHSSKHRESLLKIIYFFLMAELLIKKEFALSVLSTFDVEKSIDDIEAIPANDQTVKPTEDNISMEPLEPLEPIEPVEDIEPIADIKELEAIEALKPTKHIKDVENIEALKPIKQVKDVEAIEAVEHMEPIDRGKTEESNEEQDEAYVSARENEKVAGETFEDDLEDLDSAPPGDDRQAAAQITPFDEAPEEKKRWKFFNVTLILVFLILVIGGIILLLLPMMESTDKKENVVKKASQNKKKDIIRIEEKIPLVKKDTIVPGKMPVKTETSKPGKTAKEYFQEGNFVTAGDVWKKEIINAGVKYGILLELDCLKESVMNAYNRLSAKKDFYILNRSMGSKTCFLVMWGKFHTQEQATNAIKSNSIPNYFWQQKDPPQVIQLSRYL